MGLVRRALWPVVVLAAGVLVTSAGANVSHPSRVHKAPWYWLLLERIDLTTSRAGTVVLGLSPQRSLPLTAKLRFRVLAPSKSVANMTLSGTITCSNAGSIATQNGAVRRSPTHPSLKARIGRASQRRSPSNDPTFGGSATKRPPAGGPSNPTPSRYANRFIGLSATSRSGPTQPSGNWFSTGITMGPTTTPDGRV